MEAKAQIGAVEPKEKKSKLVFSVKGSRSMNKNILSDNALEDEK
jgi:hypothetical protein